MSSVEESGKAWSIPNAAVYRCPERTASPVVSATARLPDAPPRLVGALARQASRACDGARVQPTTGGIGGGGPEQPVGGRVSGGMGVQEVEPRGEAGRMPHVPIPPFRLTRQCENVFVRSSFALYEPTCADNPPTGATHSPVSARAGIAAVSRVSARVPPIATPPTPMVRGSVALGGSTRISGTRTSTSVNAAMP